MIPALNQHYGSNRYGVNKPLVLVFHGTTGTGKNYVADLIAKYVYDKGTDSSYVHKFLGRIDFPLDSEAFKYQVYVAKLSISFNIVF